MARIGNLGVKVNMYEGIRPSFIDVFNVMDLHVSRTL